MNHYINGKAVSFTCSECVFVPLVIQHAMRMHRYFIVICGLSDSTKVFHIINGTFFEKKLLNIKCVF